MISQLIISSNPAAEICNTESYIDRLQSPKSAERDRRAYVKGSSLPG